MDISTEHLELMQRITAHLEPHLKEGRTYHQEFYKSRYGSSGGSVFQVHEGKSYTPWHAEHNPEDTLTQGLKELDDVIRGMRGNLNLSDLYYHLPADTKVRFTHVKGQPMQMLVMDVPHLLEDLKKTIREDAMRYTTDNPEFISAEAIMRFVQQADELGIYTDETTVLSTRTSSGSSPADTNLIKCINKALGGHLEKLYYKLEGDTFVLQSKPGFPEFGITELEPENETIDLAPEYKERKDAQAEAIRLRTEFYKTLGTMLPVPIYLNVGGFRSHSWPEGSHYHTSEVLRVIYTKDSTIVITDGLSDVYTSERSDANLEYNGVGAEFYLEFEGHVTFEEVRNHFCTALLNSVTQIAIEHGDFKALIENNEHATIEFRQDNVELWCIKGMNGASNDISIFFRHGQYAPDDFGAFLNMPSKNVPAKLQLNLEEILLINIKPFSNEWLTSYKLRSEDEEVKKEVREEMMAHFEAIGEDNKIPLTYVEEGVDNTLGELFPLSDVEPRGSEINNELIESLAKNEELSHDTINEMLEQHSEFLDGGGDDGHFEQLYTASLPLNIYMTQTKAGKQFKPGMKTIPKDFSFEDADLRSSEFTGCIADGVDFRDADLTGSLFTNGFFRGANFEGADLTSVDFTDSDVTGANFRNTVLDGADFEITNCTGADFTGANTTDATFKGANMKDVKY
ncbi:hypothetical protein HYN59_12650 [Flavobacterium album]|uniref:Pentapeptide repeat-containing protein n=1 Tax=Flavobacterium album TaxID=2175091 RepID=A0A2S1QZQ6_9FLAO|nr:pentapeptide repeat-containing protein [Flavobacterium album]AWH85902.1 hypothetical protein HYN59_12650 [Flavobacterium album]